MASINFTLHVFDVVHAGLDKKDKDEITSMLNVWYLQEIVEGNISSARLRWAASGSNISPDKFDAVVFLTTEPRFGSLLKKVGGSNAKALAKDTILGETLLDAGSLPGICEVYFDRCRNNAEAAGAIFHEAAHHKLGMGDEMHTAHPNIGAGGNALRVLAANGGGRAGQGPSWGDLILFRQGVPKVRQLRTKVPP